MGFKQVNPAACRTYLLTDDNAKTAVFIDPVIDHVSDYIKMINDNGLTLTHIVDTHTHADHISAGPSLRDATDCKYIMHENAPAKCVTDKVNDGDALVLSGKKVKVLYTPGHTADSISLLFEDMILTGDFLFLEDAGAGRDDLPGGDPGSHWDSIQKLKGLSGDIMVYPAHEYRDRIPSPLSNQRVNNPHLKPMKRSEFIDYINDLHLGPADWMKDVLNANYRCATDPNAAWIPIDVPACEIKGTDNPNTDDIKVDMISQSDFSKLNPKPLLIDVREEDELYGSLGKIDGIMHIPIGTLSHRLDEIDDYKNSDIIVVCRSGARASTGAKILFTGGFNKVKVLEGGMTAYRKLN